MLKIVLADDHATLRKGMKAVLEGSGEFVVIAEAGDGEELLDILKRGIVPDVLVLDLTMPKMSGLEVLDQLGKLSLHLKVLVLTMHSDPDLLCRTLRAGASGYMLKEGIAKELLIGIRAVAEGKIYCSALMKPGLPDSCMVKSCEEPMAADFPHCNAPLAKSV